MSGRDCFVARLPSTAWAPITSSGMMGAYSPVDVEPSPKTEGLIPRWAGGVARLRVVRSMKGFFTTRNPRTISWSVKGS
jgi:hypothetical protein